jgi:hypothetical protein
MKIEKPGQYRTANGRKATVLNIEGKFAIGWVTRLGMVVPCSWTIEDGKLWGGEIGDDILDHLQIPSFVAEKIHPTRRDIKVLAPGFYRDELGRKVEVVAIRDDLAIGIWPETVPQAVGCWYARTGRDANNQERGSNLVGPYCKPDVRTVEVRMVRLPNREIRIDMRNIRNYLTEDSVILNETVVASRIITITEGEGMPLP